MRPYLTPAQVAEVLQLSESTISRMCASGAIPHVVLRAGKRKKLIRFDEAEIERWLRARARQTKKCAENGNEVATQESGVNQIAGSLKETGNSHRSSTTENAQN